MAWPYSKLVIAGNEIHPGTSRVKLGQLSRGYGQVSEFEFSEGPGAACSPGYQENLEVELTLKRDADPQLAPHFRGRIVRVNTSRGANGWTHQYLCQGREWAAAKLPIMPSNGGVRYVFNAPRDSEDYSSYLAGKTIGQIARYVLEEHEDELEQIGIGIADVADFEEIDHVTAEPILVSGESLWAWLIDFVEHWSPNHRVYLKYTATGAEIALADLLAPTTVRTLTLGVDLVEPPNYSIGIEECYTRVVLLGDDQVEMYELKQSEDQLKKSWTSTEQTAWKLKDFTEQEAAKVDFTVTSMTESVVTIDPTDNTQAWTTNYLVQDERDGRIHLERTITSSGATITYQADRPIITHTSLTAGGTSQITVPYPFTANNYTKGSIRRRKRLREHVWRKYEPVDPAVKSNLRRLFPTDQVIRFAGGSAALTGIRTPMGFLMEGGIPYQALLEIDAGAGVFWFTNPVVTHVALENKMVDLNNGTVVNTPDDVVIFAPVSVGRLQVAYPENNTNGDPVYTGLGYDWYDIARTKYVYVPGWRDPGAKTQLLAMAETIQKSLRDPVVATSLTLHGLAGHDWVGLDHAVDLRAKPGPSGPDLDLGRLQDVTLTVQSVTVTWGGADRMSVALNLSNAKRPDAAVEAYQVGISAKSLTGQYFDPAISMSPPIPMVGESGGDQ